MSRPVLRLGGALLVALAVAACSRDDQILCEDASRYSTADSIPPVRIPDGLTPPDESDSLRLPPPPADSARQSATGACLESPPPFFEDREF